MKQMKKVLALALAAVLVFALAACGGSGTAAAGIKVGIVTSSGVDDGSFGQDCYAGIQSFLKNNSNSTVTHVKAAGVGEVIQAVNDIIADYDVMVCPGYQFAAAGVTAIDNPDKNFIIVDAAPTDANGETVALDNVYSMIFKEQESGFFAGIAAAMQTKTGKVAVVNGMAFPSNVNYQFGFMAGVNYANAKLGTSATMVELPSYAGTDVTGANVGGNYIGDFNDPATGKVVGEALIKEGVDIMFIAAGGSGNGVFAAIKEASGEIYAIGCDVDQYDDGATGTRNIILTSVLKVMSINVDRQLQAMADGTFKGENALLGADTDSTGYVSAEGRHQLSEETLAALEEAYAQVKGGTIIPPDNFSESTPTNFPGLA